VKAEQEGHLTRGFGLKHAIALNISNMVGVGPFLTIPLLLATMGGPQSVLGWFVGALLVACDGQVWSELGAALPGSGGSYRFLREAYGPARWGRLMAFLFIWQFVLSGPLEIASGLIGFAQYLSYLVPQITPLGQKLVAAAVGLLAVFAISRRITFLGKLTLTLWAGTFLTMAVILVTGAVHFDAHRAFDFPPHAFALQGGFFLGLGGATLISAYDYLGYYDICYIGDEVRDPGRVIPRSILYSIAFCAVAYIGIYLVVIGVVPWREAMKSHFVVSDFMERLHGPKAAAALTVAVLWTAFASVFALLLGYSRIPYAAALDGYFFKPFARLHPTKGFPNVSLYVLGGISIAAAFLRLDEVVSGLITTRILVQFVGQVFAIPLLRKRMPDSARPFKMWLYPLPAGFAFLGWMYIFLTAGWGYVACGLLTLVVGCGAFLIWSRLAKAWPFQGASL
jgi:APA family basic amino acid/polyamine antiporter